MPTLCGAVVTEDEARATVDRLLAAGMYGAEIRLLVGADAAPALAPASCLPW